MRRDLAAQALHVWEVPEVGIVSAAGMFPEASDSGRIDDVYTHLDHRSRGYATALVGHLCRILLDAGQRPHLSVDAANPPAIRAYEKLGFVRRCQMDNLRRVD